MTMSVDIDAPNEGNRTVWVCSNMLDDSASIIRETCEGTASQTFVRENLASDAKEKSRAVVMSIACRFCCRELETPAAQTRIEDARQGA